MFDIFQSGKNALQAYETAIGTNTTNLGNINTIGFKSSQYSFQSVFDRVINGGSAGSYDRGGTNPQQTGSGVAITGSKLDFSQGELGIGAPLDLAIQGSGLFILSDDGGQTFYYSRAGKFQFSKAGKLVDSNGRQVYGFPYIGQGEFDKDNLEPIILKRFQNAGWQYEGQLGILMEDYSSSEDGNFELAGPKFQIALADFPNKSGLSQIDAATFQQSSSSGPASTPSISGQNGLGHAISAAVEKSNVFMIGETIDIQDVQRAMNASLTAIRMANQSLDSLMSIFG